MPEVKSRRKNIKLTEALQQMLIQDVQRLFVSDPKSETIVGVLSLSDEAPTIVYD